MIHNWINCNFNKVQLGGTYNYKSRSVFMAETGIFHINQWRSNILVRHIRWFVWPLKNKNYLTEKITLVFSEKQHHTLKDIIPLLKKQKRFCSPKNYNLVCREVAHNIIHDLNIFVTFNHTGFNVYVSVGALQWTVTKIS